jgi:hypothetical protein
MRSGTLTMSVLLLCGSAAIAQDISLPRATLEDGFKKAECTVDFEGAAKEAESFDLGGGKKLFLVNCWSAAYQSGSIAFVADASRARLQTFQTFDGKRFKPFASLSGGDYDPDKKTLNSFYKGRGIGDCGSMGEWKWNGAEFKMSAYFYKAKCDGQSFDGGKRWQVFPRR